MLWSDLAPLYWLFIKFQFLLGNFIFPQCTSKNLWYATADCPHPTAGFAHCNRELHKHLALKIINAIYYQISRGVFLFCQILCRNGSHCCVNKFRERIILKRLEWFQKRERFQKVLFSSLVQQAGGSGPTEWSS